MNKKHNRRFWRAALVALLLILMAGILFGILAPALMKPDGRPAPSCKSNLKQLALAMLMYANDYDHFPPSSIKMFDPSTKKEAEFGWPAILVWGGYIDMDYGGKMKPMPIKRNVFVCWKHRKAAAKFSRRGIYCSYAMNRETSGVYYPYPKWGWFPPVEPFPRPYVTFLLADSDFMEIGDNWHIKFNRQCAFDFRHRPDTDKPPGANFAFCDGHVEYLRFKSPATWNHAPFPLDCKLDYEQDFRGHFWGGSVLERVRKRAGAKVKEARPSGLLSGEKKEWLWYICRKSGHRWKMAKDDPYFVRYLSGKEPNTPVTCPQGHYDAYPAAVCPECGHIYLDLDDSNICPNCGPF